MIDADTSKTTYQRNILDNLNTAILVLDANLDIKYINPASENLFQISYQRALKVNLNKILHIDAAFKQRLQNTCLNLHPFSEHEGNLTLTDGREIIIDYHITALQAADQDVQLLLEIAHMDRHIRIAREEKLLSEQHATRNLVRGMAHEIKNPLGGLRGAAQLLERELPTEELKEYTQIIIGEADRLRSLVDRVLGPNNIPQKRSINIHQVLEHVRQLIQIELTDNQHIHFILDYDPSLPEILADFDMMIQIILNITRNAVQALDGQGEITYKTRPLRNFNIGHTYHRLILQVDIMDNGPGVPEDLQEQIFYPMVTGRADGTGLGLSIAQSLINQHGGLIKMHSHPGETDGQTIFTIFIPLEKH